MMKKITDSEMKASTIVLVVLTSAILQSSNQSSLIHGAPTFQRFEVSGSEDAEHLIGGVQGQDLYVDIRNNMAATNISILVGCAAFSDNQQLLTSLGNGPVPQTHRVIYWMNLVMFHPAIATVVCNVTTPVGNSRVLTMYDDDNIELSYLLIQWSIDERGFSLYDSVTKVYDLYQTW